MSKIVILGTQLAAPQILCDLIDKIAVQDPLLAEWISQLDTIPIIKECAINALNSLIGKSGIQKALAVLDFYGKSFVGSVDGAIATDKLPNGLGVRVSASGAIEFIADQYESGWKKEIKRLQDLYKDAFLNEISKAILTILGYEVQVQAVPTGDGKFSYNLEGVKQ